MKKRTTKFKHLLDIRQTIIDIHSMESCTFLIPIVDANQLNKSNKPLISENIFLDLDTAGPQGVLAITIELPNHHAHPISNEKTIRKDFNFLLVKMKARARRWSIPIQSLGPNCSVLDGCCSRLMANERALAGWLSSKIRATARTNHHWSRQSTHNLWSMGLISTI